ncbi:hypothetical protein Tco_0366777 [Tanacetum coccineum]
MLSFGADIELKDNIVVAMPKHVGGRVLYVSLAKLSKVFRLVLRWDLNQSNKCTDRHVSKKNNVNTSGNKKKDADPTKEVSNSNPIDMLNSVENHVDLGTNDGTLNRASKKANSRGSSLWNGETLEKANSSGDHDSEDEVKSVDNEMTSFLASKKVSYGTNNLPEQWKETYENDDYDYDNTMMIYDDLPSEYYKDLLCEMYKKRLKKHMDYEQLIDVLAMNKSKLEEELRAAKSKMKLYDKLFFIMLGSFLVICVGFEWYENVHDNVQSAMEYLLLKQMIME